MVKRLIIAAVVLMLACVPAMAADWAIYGLQMPSPEHNNTFDNSFGVEGQYRMPIDDGPLSLGLSLGVSQLDSEDYGSTVRNGFMLFRHWIPTSTVNTRITGDVQSFTLGAALLYEIPIASGVNLVAQAGVKHHLMSSDVEMTVHTTTHSLFGPDSRSSTVTNLDYDNPTTCELGANIEIDVADNIAALIGAVYVFDMNHDHVSAAGQPLWLTNGLEGTVFRAGLVFRH